jgi:hypothetical protein
MFRVGHAISCLVPAALGLEVFCEGVSRCLLCYVPSDEMGLNMLRVVDADWILPKKDIERLS